MAKKKSKKKPKTKFDTHLDKCMAQAEKLNLKVERKLMHRVLLSLGPTIYHRDASTVATSDPKEMAYVKKTFLKGKLGMKDDGVMDGVLEKVRDEMKESGTPKKYRAVFYVSILGKLNLDLESFF